MHMVVAVVVCKEVELVVAAGGEGR